jgi:hypothetical protein
MLKKYLLTLIRVPWSFILLINVICFAILIIAQQSNKIICPDSGVCAKDIIQTLNLNEDYPFFTMVSYFGFYFFGLLFAHVYSFYSEEKGNTLNAQLAKTLACFLVAILIVFTGAIGYVYLTFGNQVQ